ncbi:MAG: glycerophosphodiester phosphodiesterase [Steroidobacteraceae bacterium]|nr:glycerophosphodiester phosphodiesterase [Steroidobacteraceae bacterium]
MLAQPLPPRSACERGPAGRAARGLAARAALWLLCAAPSLGAAGTGVSGPNAPTGAVAAAATAGEARAAPAAPAAPARPLVIAHRGASGYLPEHTLVAKAYAYAAGADYLEQDVVLTRDDVPVVLHDLTLEGVTDVETVYPERRRADGRWYAIDFTHAELQRLAVHERVDPASGQPSWAARFHERGLPLRIHSLADELTLVRGLNAATGRDVGVYTEVKSPAWHRAQGKDPSVVVLRTLAEFGYRNRADRAYVQCFDFDELRRMRTDLATDLRLVQLIGENAWAESATDYERLRTVEGLREVARYADGIGPWIPHVVTWPEGGGAPSYTALVRDAHAVGLVVHPYTFRIDQLPPNAPDPEAVHRALFEIARVDGVFTDFPDRTQRWLGR